jgi:hypothetical protein
MEHDIRFVMASSGGERMKRALERTPSAGANRIIPSRLIRLKSIYFGVAG